jgi:para-aminobenzoate synthetase/4-amino-4-deoxychorismate lyase
MRIEPAPRRSGCGALLDDMSAGAASRLYTAHVGTLSIMEAAAVPAVMDEMQRLLARGLHAVGVFSYELGAAMHGVQAPSAGHTLGRFLLFETYRSLQEAEVVDWLRSQGDGRTSGVANVRADVTQTQFEANVRRIQEYIAAGDTYQVNHTWRLEFDAYGNPADLYARLRRRQRVPYGAYITLPEGSTVLSRSPELFLRHTAGELRAKPMKGTAPACAGDAQNLEQARALAADPKNRAENVMIVDLMRNDLGRLARQGTVKVPALFEVERFGEVLQMTSTVQAQLRADSGLAQVFGALYPCGSITGAPKRRTMQIIQEMELSPRSIYTGGIGWFDPPAAGNPLGDFCLSVPIRTLVLDPARGNVRRGRMGVGSGIVADSDPAREWEECRLKAKFLTGLPHDFELVETLRASRAHGCVHLQRHLARLAASAAWFGIPVDTVALAAEMREATVILDAHEVYRLRVALQPLGSWSVHASVLPPLGSEVLAFVADAELDQRDVFLAHKTTVRAELDRGWKDAEARGGFDTLFFNRRSELAQGGRSNVFVKLRGRWYTPPVGSGALPGVMRAVLLADARFQAAERVISRQDLMDCEEIFLCSSLRGVMRARLRESARAASA